MRASVVAAILCLALSAQAPNDSCATAFALSGTVTASNAGATTGPDPVPACGAMTEDVWFFWFAPCGGTWTASTCAQATGFATVVAVWNGAGSCGALAPVACSDVCSGPFQGASASFLAVPGALYFISVGGNGGGTGTFELSMTLGAGMTLSFFSTVPGTLGYVVAEGPSSGTAFVAMTPNQGQFPVGWFYGIDVGWLELIGELTFGFPFVTPLQPCGSAIVGPATGLPPGFTIYGVALGLAPGGTSPVAWSFPAVGVAP